MNDIEDIIKRWGVPPVWKGEAVTFKFKTASMDSYAAKFTIVDSNQTPLFTMDFFKPSDRFNSMGGDNRKIMELALIHTHRPSDRKKGISTFYIRKLVDFCVRNGFQVIKLNVCADQQGIEGYSKENALNQDELIQFYQKVLDDPRMDRPIILVNNENINAE